MKRVAHILLSLVLVVAFLTAGKGVVFEHCLCSNRYSLIVNGTGCCKKNAPCMETVVERVSPSCVAVSPSFSFDNPFLFSEAPAACLQWVPALSAKSLRELPLVASAFYPPPRAYLLKICLLQI